MAGKQYKCKVCGKNVRQTSGPGAPRQYHERCKKRKSKKPVKVKAKPKRQIKIKAKPKSGQTPFVFQDWSKRPSNQQFRLTPPSLREDARVLKTRVDERMRRESWRHPYNWNPRKRGQEPATVIMLNASTDPGFVVNFRAALQSINEIRPITVIDITQLVPNFIQILRNSIEKATDTGRNQVDARKLLYFLAPVLAQSTTARECRKVILLDEDLYTEGLNWCFGVGFGSRYLVLSRAQLQDAAHQRFLSQHELGHIFNAPTEQRPRIVEHLGAHCTVPLCAMQQKDTVESSHQYALEREAANTPVYCKHCARDISKSLAIPE